jgi:hypothetical protein
VPTTDATERNPTVNYANHAKKAEDRPQITPIFADFQPPTDYGLPITMLNHGGPSAAFGRNQKCLSKKQVVTAL